MNWVKKANPINSLFGRIFLWFWLAAILLVLIGAWTAKQVSGSYSVRPIQAEHAAQIEQIAFRIRVITQRRPDANLSLVLRRAGQRDKLALLLIEQQSREFIYGFPRRLGPLKGPFLDLIEQQQAYKIDTSAGVFFGPQKMVINGKNYALFAGRPKPTGSIRQLARANPVLLSTIALVISAALCAMFTWTLVKPIRSLQKSAKKVAQGDLSQQEDIASVRGDELGDLGKGFNQMTKRLSDLIDGQKRLVADISHELRSPLARLQLAIGIAHNNQDTIPDNIIKQLQRIEKEATQIDHMIEQVLKLSRLEANVPVDDLQQVDLASVLEPVCNDCRFEAQNLGKDLDVQDIPQLRLSCYPQLLASAVRNLLNNGLKYSSTKVEMSFEQQTAKLVIRVKDDGAGVDSADLTKMFEPFYRLSTSRTRETGGVGLGLAIVKQAILLHGGDIKAQNCVNNGFEVVVTIPINQV